MATGFISSKLLGVSQNTFRVNTVSLVDNSTVLEVRDRITSNLAIVRAADPVGVTDVVTKQWVIPANIPIAVLGTPSCDSLLCLDRDTQSAGKFSGFSISAVDATHIGISAGTARSRTSDSLTADFVTFDMSDTASLAITPSVVNYVFIDYNGGTPIISVALDEDTINRNTQIPIGACVGDGVELPHVFDDGVLLPNWITSEQKRLLEVRRGEHAYGGITSHTGTRNVYITAGVFYIAGTRKVFSLFDSSGTDTFTTVYSNGGGGWTYTDAQTQVSNAYYDNGTGTLASLTVNKYGVYWVFLLADSSVYIKYGLGDYTLAQAQAAQIPSTLPDELAYFSILAAKIIVQQGSSSFYSVTPTYNALLGVTAPSVHNTLAGLQGGALNEYYHLTSAEYTNKVSASSTLTSGYIVVGAGSKSVSVTGITVDASNNVASVGSLGCTSVIVPDNGTVGMTGGPYLTFLDNGTNQIVAVTGDVTATGRISNTLTTEQLRLAYDSTHYVPFTVGATGILTIAPNNTGAASYVSITGRLGVGTAAPGAVIEAALSTGVIGVKGTSDTANGGYFTSSSKAGIVGSSTSGAGVYGVSTSYYGGWFASDTSRGAYITTRLGICTYIHKTGTLTASESANVLYVLRDVDGASSWAVSGNIIAITDNPTNCTSISGYLLTATIGATERVRFNPRVVDGASAVAYFWDTNAALSTAGAKLASWRNNGVEKAAIYYDGQGYFAGRIGVGTASPSDTINAVAPASGGEASLGSELLTNGTFDSSLTGWTAGDANWAWGAGGTADHAAGATGTLTQAIATTSGRHYQFVITISAYTAGTLTATLTSSTGSESFALTSATTYTYSFKAGAASSTLTLTPTSTFVGSITSVSLKLITPASVYTIATMDTGSARSGICSITTDDALNNLFVGIGNGALNTTGYSNSAFGVYALLANTTGNYNSAFGMSALAANTTGYYNSAFGTSALQANTTGYYNSAFGRSALAANTTGYSNSAFGRSALEANTTGNYSIAFGISAGRYYGSGTSAITSAIQSVFLGCESRASANGNTNEIVIGYNAVGAGSNSATLGNTSITTTILRGNFGNLTGAYGTSAVNNVGIASGTAPSASYPANAAGFWVEDRNGVAGRASIHIWAENGAKHVLGDLVGIGTIAPSAALHVVRSSGIVFCLEKTGSLTANDISSNFYLSRTSDGGSTYNTTGNIITIVDAPTNCPTVSGYHITSSVNGYERFRFNPRVTDGATAVAYFSDTMNALSTAGAKLWSFRTNNVEKAYIGGGGEGYLAGAFGCNGATPQTPATANVLSAYATGAYGFDSDAHAQEIHTLLGQIRTALINDGIMVSA